MKNHVLMKNTHLLGVNNFYQTEYPKKQIVIGNSFSKGLTHVTGWRTRVNGKYKKTAPFTITRDGTIYFHYDPKHHSEFIGTEEIDKNIIPIVLENEGWLTKDSDSEGYLNWVGDIYNEDDGIIETRWRNHRYWSSYTDEQIESLVRLCKYLCERFEIPLETLAHNTKADVDFFEGVLYKSNYSKYYTDVSPAFDANEFKNKLEIN
jgi:N-acetyl-anhydromuramyl-L-alanine amidase AmpD